MRLTIFRYPICLCATFRLYYSCSVWLDSLFLYTICLHFPTRRILFSVLAITLCSIRSYRTYSLISVYLLYFPYTPRPMSRLFYYILLFTIQPIRPYAYTIAPKLRGDLFPVSPTLPDYLPARRPHTWMATLFPYSTPISIGKLEKYARRTAIHVALSFLTLPVYISPYYCVGWFLNSARASFPPSSRLPVSIFQLIAPTGIATFLRGRRAYTPVYCCNLLTT